VMDWIDELFEQVETEEEVSDRQRDWLISQIEACRFPDNVAESYIDRVLSSDLDRATYREMATTMQMNVLDIRYVYAPSQREIARFIRSFCFPDDE